MGEGKGVGDLNFPRLGSPPRKTCVTTSLRGSGTTEAISQEFKSNEIATLSRQGGIARNDKKGGDTISKGGGNFRLYSN